MATCLVLIITAVGHGKGVSPANHLAFASSLSLVLRVLVGRLRECLVSAGQRQPWVRAFTSTLFQVQGPKVWVQRILLSAAYSLSCPLHPTLSND